MLATLDDVVAFYDAGGGGDPLKDRRLKPLNLVPSEKADLTAFLEALSGETFDTDAYVWRADDYDYEVIENWRETAN
jgi:cytochrome c peroxidase